MNQTYLGLNARAEPCSVAVTSTAPEKSVKKEEEKAKEKER
jgi:hypothetical protein